MIFEAMFPDIDPARAAPEAPPPAATQNLCGEGRPCDAPGARAATTSLPGGNSTDGWEGMDGSDPPGFDAAPSEGEPMADDDLPSDTTFYVAHAIANDALVKLAMSLAVELAMADPAERTRSGRQLVARAIEQFGLAADFSPAPIADTLAELGPYDADTAESMAMEIVGDALELIRMRVVG